MHVLVTWSIIFYLVQDLLLCGAYARIEAAAGNIDLARKIFDMALCSVTDLSLVCISI